MNAGVDVNAKTSALDRTALICAADAGQLEAVRWLLSRGASPDAREAVDADGCGARSPLHAAAWACSEACVEALLGAGADPGAADADGETPLLVAAKCGATGTVRRLLEAGADPSAVDNNGYTAKDKAEARGHGALMQGSLAEHLEVAALLERVGCRARLPPG